MIEEPNWKPPTFKETKSDKVSLCLRQINDASMVKFAERLDQIVQAAIVEGATGFHFQWKNILDRYENPDGDIGFLLVTATR